MIPKLIDTMELEIPGEKMNTISSTSRLLREVKWSEGRDRRRINRIEELKREKILKEEEALKAEEEAKKLV